ncbi:DUF2058 domain-containing protein [Paraglaciecola sp. L1A13]|uniref:DUF2058 domain-containing protein n=1 Tax=Paraglaciecola sp. L1A13 TaxID=2686359 RepID=UPI00131A8A7A|nr:DUF2058 domain-containing protein [Paraglaciecola sp. L1A13]
MALSLQEQLLQAGLANKKKAKQVRQQKHKQAKAKQNHNIDQTNESKIAAEQAVEQKKARDRELNKMAKAEAEKKAVQAQIVQMINVNKQSRRVGDIACNFSDNKVIKRIFVDKKIHAQITQGQLAIVKLNDAYELIPMPVADKIAERDESYVLYRADILPEEKAKNSQDEDWYADYDIPDDLSW